MRTRFLAALMCMLLLVSMVTLSSAGVSEAWATDMEHLAYGDWIGGTIGMLGEVDVYTFNGSAGDIVLIRMTDGSAYMESYIELFDPQGTRLEEHSGGTQAVIQDVSLPVTGVYTILASDALGDETGNYGLALQCVSNPGQAILIEYGDNTKGAIEGLAAFDTYTFAGREGDTAVIRMTDGSAYMESYIELFDPQGTRLKEHSGGTQAVIQDFPLPATGVYTILASDALGDETGNCGLALQCVSKPGQAIGIAYGDTVEGSISQLAELDAYTFAGREGDTVVIRMTDGSAYMESYIELFDPQGTRLKEHSGGTQAVIQDFPLPATGVYTILASDALGDETGGYGLSLVGLPNQETGGLHGYVLESGTGTGLAASVLVIHANTKERYGPMSTDTQGYYEFGNLPPGFYHVLAATRGFRFDIERNIDVGPGESTSVPDLELASR